MVACPSARTVAPAEHKRWPTLAAEMDITSSGRSGLKAGSGRKGQAEQGSTGSIMVVITG
ncbi:hypothetical protein GCM10011320_52110 [Neoroseomonas lacus]|uniref:Uncharacterized protein n=1 Tax=Neoroseomonas lacus TaxID=287609 RepID=A0A917NXI8_9PROT|nr:hypothetical protein GCM10011320_52110 [Neoroseomonas lacus]